MKKLYSETFDRIQAPSDYAAAVEARTRPAVRGGYKKMLVAVAAALTLVLAFSATALATNLFNIRDLILEPTSEVQLGDEQTVTVTKMSLQGYSESPEYKAGAEWQAFLSTYDQDGAILAKVGNNPTGFEEKYGYDYLIYSQEMADKFDEILARYGLSMMGEWKAFDEGDVQAACCALTGAKPFFAAEKDGSTNIFNGGYGYTDGTFQLEGTAKMASGSTLEYQFRNSRKGIFSEVYLNIGDPAQYTEWEYVNAAGTTLSLAMGEYKSLVIAELDDSFVVVNVLNGQSDDRSSERYWGPSITPAELEAFADMIDFRAINA